MAHYSAILLSLALLLLPAAYGFKSMDSTISRRVHVPKSPFFSRRQHNAPLAMQAEGAGADAATGREATVFIANFPYTTTIEDLKEAGSAYGSVQEVRLIVDKFTGRSRGFGFMTFGSAEEAAAAVSGMDNKDFGGRSLRVNPAAPKEPGFRPQGGYNSGYNSGGYNSGGGYGNGNGGYRSGGYRNNGGFRSNRGSRGDGGYGGNGGYGHNWNSPSMDAGEGY